MRAKISFITLAVDDLSRSVAFYRDGLGWHTEGIVGQEFHDEVTGADGTIAFFTLEPGLMLGLYERTNLAKDAGLLPAPPSSTEFSVGIPAASQAEVDELLRQAGAAGGTLTAPAHMRPFGVYSGYFTDPDGHLFEIAWNSAEQNRGVCNQSLDFSAVQLARARHLVPAARLVQADMTALHLRPASLDAVVSFYALIHLPLADQQALFPRIRSWLRTGGYLLATTGAQRWTGTEPYLGADMFWDHADTATYLNWLTAERLVPIWHRYIPEGSAGHSLILARAS